MNKDEIINMIFYSILRPFFPPGKTLSIHPRHQARLDRGNPARPADKDFRRKDLLAYTSAFLHCAVRGTAPS
jgi:hypothetical protein